jgi:osmotically-inducible protein OsmY
MKETTMSFDSDLQKSVQEELSWEPNVTAAHIGVTAKDGVIALTGHVDNYTQKFAAERAAERVKGVKAVAEELEVRLAIDDRRSDEEIAAAALNRLAWDVSVPRNAVMVKVEKGWVTLSGEVEWHFQKLAAEQDVRALHGVVGVSNQTRIKARVDAGHIRDDIMHALNRSWFFDPAISVTAEGGKVRLSGTVRSPHERQVAGATAWGAPGATAVENDILVS